MSHNNSFSKKKWHTPDLDPSSQILWLNIHNATWTRLGILPSFESKFRRMNFVLSSSFTAQQTCVRFVLHSTHDDGKRKSQHSSSFGQRLATHRWYTRALSAPLQTLLLRVATTQPLYKLERRNGVKIKNSTIHLLRSSLLVGAGGGAKGKAPLWPSIPPPLYRH